MFINKNEENNRETLGNSYIFDPDDHYTNYFYSGPLGEGVELLGLLSSEAMLEKFPTPENFQFKEVGASVDTAIK